MRWQAGWCERLGSPLYAELLGRAAEDIEAGGPAWAVLQGQEADAKDSSTSLALRLMGSVHRLALEGLAPDLAWHYPSAGGRPGDAWPAFRAVLDEHHDALRDLIERPVQTNEVGRSASLLERPDPARATARAATAQQRAKGPARSNEAGQDAHRRWQAWNGWLLA